MGSIFVGHKTHVRTKLYWRNLNKTQVKIKFVFITPCVLEGIAVFIKFIIKRDLFLAVESPRQQVNSPHSEQNMHRPVAASITAVETWGAQFK